jgi:hypothetical protein
MSVALPLDFPLFQISSPEDTTETVYPESFSLDVVSNNPFILYNQDLCHDITS